MGKSRVSLRTASLKRSARRARILRRMLRKSSSKERCLPLGLSFWAGVVTVGVHPAGGAEQLLIADFIREKDHLAEGDVDGVQSATGHTVEIRALAGGGVELDRGDFEFRLLGPADGGKQEGGKGSYSDIVLHHREECPDESG